MVLAMKIEEMAHEAETLRSLALAVYDAIYNGCNDYKEFDYAFHLVFCMAHEHMEHLNSLTDEAFTVWRTKNQESFDERQKGGNSNAKNSFDHPAEKGL